MEHKFGYTSMLSIGILSLVSTVTGRAQQTTHPSTPNLVFIMADQCRSEAIGCLGKESVKTPCLDKLASEGVLFTNAVSSYPIHNKVVGNCNSPIQKIIKNMVGANE